MATCKQPKKYDKIGYNLFRDNLKTQHNVNAKENKKMSLDNVNFK